MSMCNSVSIDILDGVKLPSCVTRQNSSACDADSVVKVSMCVLVGSHALNYIFFN
jgi:hypothetical protein